MEELEAWMDSVECTEEQCTEDQLMAWWKQYKGDGVWGEARFVGDLSSMPPVRRCERLIVEDNGVLVEILGDALEAGCFRISGCARLIRLPRKILVPQPLRPSVTQPPGYLWIVAPASTRTPSSTRWRPVALRGS